MMAQLASLILVVSQCPVSRHIRATLAGLLTAGPRGCMTGPCISHAKDYHCVTMLGSLHTTQAVVDCCIHMLLSDLSGFFVRYWLFYKYSQGCFQGQLCAWPICSTCDEIIKDERRNKNAWMLESCLAWCLGTKTYPPPPPCSVCLFSIVKRKTKQIKTDSQLILK